MAATTSSLYSVPAYGWIKSTQLKIIALHRPLTDEARGCAGVGAIVAFTVDLPDAAASLPPLPEFATVSATSRVVVVVDAREQTACGFTITVGALDTGNVVAAR